MVFTSDKQRKAVMAKLKGGARSNVTPRVVLTPSSKKINLKNVNEVFFTRSSKTKGQLIVTKKRGMADFLTIKTLKGKLNLKNVRKIFSPKRVSEIKQIKK